MQIVDTLMVGRFGTDLTDFHQILPADGYGIAEMVDIPKLEKGHIQTYMGRIEPVVCGDAMKKAGEMMDVVHCFLIFEKLVIPIE
jgi:hypothetical protein